MNNRASAIQWKCSVTTRARTLEERYKDDPKLLEFYKQKLLEPRWAVDANFFDQQVKPFAKWFVIWDNESDTKWRVSVEHFDQHKGTLDRGFGLQYFLALSQWEIIEPNGNRQLSLWGDEGNGQKS